MIFCYSSWLSDLKSIEIQARIHNGLERSEVREWEDRMRRYSLVVLAGVMLVTACDSSTKPTNANFRKAINQYLAKHGEACAWIGRPFPIDIPDSELGAQSGTGFQMVVLERVGLVRSTDAVAIAPVILGRPVTHHVRRYEPTDAGKRYLQQAPVILGQSAGFCYGDKTVDTVVKWTQPVTAGAATQAEAIYTYKLLNLAPWAEQPEIQNAFGDIRSTVTGISRSNEIIGLELTNRGWEVPER